MLCIRDWHNIVNQLYFYFKKTVLFIVTSKSIKYRGINLTKDDKTLGFPGGAVVENLPANAGDTGSSPGLGRSHMPRSN